MLWLHTGIWVLLAFASNLVAVALGLFTVTMPWFGIAAYNYQLQVTPDEMRGRVGTSFNLLLWATTPIAGSVAGALLETVSTGATAIIVGAWVLLLALSATMTGRLKNLHSPS